MGSGGQDPGGVSAMAPESGLPARCFYCLDDRVSIGVCLDCRTKLEDAREENKRLKRDLDLTRRSYWKLLRERERSQRRRGS